MGTLFDQGDTEVWSSRNPQRVLTVNIGKETDSLTLSVRVDLPFDVVEKLLAERGYTIVDNGLPAGHPKE